MPHIGRRLLWLISPRVAIVTFLLGAGVLAEIEARTTWINDPFFFLVAITYALTVVYALTLHRALRQRWLVDLQFGIDTCLISALVLMTGGVTSFFSSLYALPILAAGAVQDRQSGSHSTEGVGTTVEVQLPARLHSVALREYEEATQLMSSSSTSLPDGRQPATILVADDEPSMREMLSIVLQREGYRVLLADAGRAAVELLRQEPVDILVSDVRISDMNGVDLLPEAKHIDPAGDRHHDHGVFVNRIGG